MGWLKATILSQYIAWLNKKLLTFSCYCCAVFKCPYFMGWSIQYGHATIHPSIHPFVEFYWQGSSFQTLCCVQWMGHSVGWGPAFDLKDSPIEQFRSRQGVQWKSIVCYFHLMHGSLGNYGKGWIAKEINRICAVVDLETPWAARGTLSTSTVTLGYPRGPTRPEKNKAWLRLSVKHPRTEWLLAGFIFETPHVMKCSVLKYKE